MATGGRARHGRDQQQPDVVRLLNRPVDDVARAFFPAIQGHWAAHGYGPWAIQRRDDPDSSMIGFAGLAFPPLFLADAPAGPELGWRRGRSAWGHGYAYMVCATCRAWLSTDEEDLRVHRQFHDRLSVPDGEDPR